MELNALDDLYRDVILDHCRNPRKQHNIEHPDIVADAVNPFCGDEIHIRMNLDSDGRVNDIGFEGEGCSINQSAGSMLAEVIESNSLEEMEALSELFRRLMKGETLSEDEQQQLGDLTALQGVLKFPIRIKCALLSMSAIEQGIENYRNGR